MEKHNKINKNIVPNDFTITLALIDFMPVLFFFGISIILSIMLKSNLFFIGSIISFISGFLKVIWKIIVVIKKKNIWILFLQMRIIMPLGFLISLIGIIIFFITKDSNILLTSFKNIPSIIFLILGLIGIVLMIVFSFILDSSNKKANWIEQICNSFAQLFILIACLFAIL